MRDWYGPRCWPYGNENLSKPRAPWGATNLRILTRHILPNIIQPVMVQAAIGMAGTILAEATLSFLGLGVPPPMPSWGVMLNDARAHLFDAPHMVIFPPSPSCWRCFPSTLSATPAGSARSTYPHHSRRQHKLLNMTHWRHFRYSWTFAAGSHGGPGRMRPYPACGGHRRRQILDELRKIAPLTAIRGNVDNPGPAPRSLRPGNRARGKSLLLVHRRQDLDLHPHAAGIAAVIFGHSHAPEILRRWSSLFQSGKRRASPLRPAGYRRTSECASNGIIPSIQELLS